MSTEESAAQFAKGWMALNVDEGSKYGAKAIGLLLARALMDAFKAGYEVHEAERVVVRDRTIAGTSMTRQTEGYR